MGVKAPRQDRGHKRDFLGLWREVYEKEGYNPFKQQMKTAMRTKIKIEYELPLGEQYADLVQELLLNAKC